jgi:hypothetical protein
MTSTTAAAAAAVVCDSGRLNQIQYLQCLELGYTHTSTTSTNNLLLTTRNLCCFQCGKKQDATVRLSRCSQCQVAAYCSRTCQIHHWKTNTTCNIGGVGHKYACRSK